MASDSKSTTPPPPPPAATTHVERIKKSGSQTPPSTKSGGKG
jgi:hypothetical protein